MIRKKHCSEGITEGTTEGITARTKIEEVKTMRKIGISGFSTKPTNFYNLDVIISVGYRVKAVVGTRFRQGATERLAEYLIKGFTMDDERLKNLGWIARKLTRERGWGKL